MKSQGAGSSKQASSKRASGRPDTPSNGGGPDCEEEPNSDGHRPGQGNGWQRGFLNHAASSHNKTATATASVQKQELEPDGSHAESSEASSSEQWEPDDSQNGHFAVRLCPVLMNPSTVLYASVLVWWSMMEFIFSVMSNFCFEALS